MEEKEYIDEIIKLQQEIKAKELSLSNLIQNFKRDKGFMEGDRVKVTRIAGDEHYLIIKSSWFNPKTLRFHYKFSHITSKGKEDGGFCGVHHHESDKIEKIK